MEVIEKSHEGLSRSFGVRVPAAELGEALNARIAEILPTLRLKGFRPGKVPAAHVRRLYGKALMGEVVEKTLEQTSQKVLADQQLRVAAQPDLRPVSNMDQVLAGREDLAYDIEVEVMPDFDPAPVDDIALERLVYEPSEAEIDEALARIAADNRRFVPRLEDEGAQEGDQVRIDFQGSIDGELFEGGSAEDADLTIGSNRFIPGFEPQLIGVRAGESRTVEVDFPADYPVERLSGRHAVFEVQVKTVSAPQEGGADDEMAKSVGFEDLAALRAALKDNLAREYQSASRFKIKRALLDVLDGRHEIPLPPRMVAAEFEQIWSQVQKDIADGQQPPEDAGKDEETLRGEYRKIAERRVRLGLVLAEIGRRAGVAVTEAELSQAMRTEALRYGEKAAEVFAMMRENPGIQASIRAPLYEEKVVDLILSQAQVTDRPVSREELLRDDDMPEGWGDEVDTGEAAALAPAQIEAAANDAGEASAEAAPPAEADAVAPAAKPRRRPAKAKAAESGSEEPAAEAAAPAEAAPKPRKARAKAKVAEPDPAGEAEPAGE